MDRELNKLAQARRNKLVKFIVAYQLFYYRVQTNSAVNKYNAQSNQQINALLEHWFTWKPFCWNIDYISKLI